MDFNASRIFEEKKAKGYTGGYSTVKEVVRPLRETIHRLEIATIRFETPPGRQAQMDWGTVNGAPGMGVRSAVKVRYGLGSGNH